MLFRHFFQGKSMAPVLDAAISFMMTKPEEVSKAYGDDCNTSHKTKKEIQCLKKTVPQFLHKFGFEIKVLVTKIPPFPQ